VHRNQKTEFLLHRCEFLNRITSLCPLNSYVLVICERHATAACVALEADRHVLDAATKFELRVLPSGSSICSHFHAPAHASSDEVEPRQMRAGAEMLALPNAIVRWASVQCRSDTDVESLPRRDPRGKPQRQQVALADKLAAELEFGASYNPRIWVIGLLQRKISSKRRRITEGC